ncbi:hypothetical protein PVL29_019437 [Vitis rotundifolia]|uniref:Uncharacterized protein n=1 Tax=Vitis rotundifolia TaxID=103349 RepID=A0AA38Z0J3_VITRO|nr:hypothetical protein PVL29_019437 [Vitis rotundifolia]
MASNLRAEFKERQRKRLFEALSALPSLDKKTRLEVSRDEPIIDTPMVQAPSFDVVRSRQELVPNPPIEDTCPAKDETPTTTPGGKVNQRDAPINPSSWEDIAALLKSVSSAWRPSSCWRGPPLPCLFKSLHFGALIRCKSTLSRRRQKWGVTTIHNLIRQRSSLLKRLEKSLKKLEKGMQAEKVEVHRMGEEKKVAEVKCKNAEQKRDQLKEELDKLRAASKA